MRAYAGAAHAALAAAGVSEYLPFTYYAIDCTYPDYQKIQPELARIGVTDRGIDFTDSVHIEIGIPSEKGGELCRRIEELTAGRSLPFETGRGMDLAPES